MAKKNSSKLNWRAFTSIFILFSFLIIGISGIILYFAPPGRIAHWSQWRLISLTKESWQAVHTIFAFTFIIMAIFHLKFNWKPLMAYIKRRLQESSKVRKELTLSASFSLLIFVLTLVAVPPFGTVMDWGEALSNSWANEQTEPPVPHAELMTLEELAQSMQMQISEVLQSLKAQSIEPESTSVIIGELAEKYQLTPNQLYEKIQKNVAPANLNLVLGSGYGRKTLAEVCSELGIPISSCMANLQTRGVEASDDSNLRDLASKYNVNPTDIVNMIQSSHETKMELSE